MTYPNKIVSTLNDDILEIRWMPHNVCNFKCKYCFPGSHEGDQRASDDYDLVIKNFDHFISYYEKTLGKKKIHFKILGGEPTLYNGLEKLLTVLKSNHNIYSTIISNASRTLRWWKENGHLLDNAVLSYHYGQGDLLHHIAVADELFAKGKKVTVLVLMDPDHWEECVADIESMKKQSKYSWFINAKELVDYGQETPICYTDKQKKYLRWEVKRMPSVFWFIKNYKLIFDGTIRIFQSTAILDNGKKIRATAQTYINKGWNKFAGWSCNIGSSVVFVNSSGNIEGSCGQMIYNVPFKYNILDPNFIEKFKPDFNPTICSISSCHCEPETHISKFNLGKGDISRTRTIIPIADDRLLRNIKSSSIDIT